MLLRALNELQFIFIRFVYNVTPIYKRKHLFKTCSGCSSSLLLTNLKVVYIPIISHISNTSSVFKVFKNKNHKEPNRKPTTCSIHPPVFHPFMARTGVH